MIKDKLIVIDIDDETEIRLRTRLFSQLDDEDSDVDMDRLLKIDMANLEAELVTFPVVLNVLGIMLAEATNRHNLAKFNLEIYQAKTKERLRKEHLASDEDEEEAKSKRGKKSLTIDEVESRLVKDTENINKTRKMFKLQKEMEFLNSLYWSAKSKDERLNKLSLTIKTGDIYDRLAASKIDRINMIDISDIKPKKQ